MKRRPLTTSTYEDVMAIGSREEWIPSWNGTERIFLEQIILGTERNGSFWNGLILERNGTVCSSILRTATDFMERNGFIPRNGAVRNGTNFCVDQVGTERNGF